LAACIKVLPVLTSTRVENYLLEAALAKVERILIMMNDWVTT